MLLLKTLCESQISLLRSLSIAAQYLKSQSKFVYFLFIIIELKILQVEAFFGSSASRADMKAPILLFHLRSHLRKVRYFSACRDFSAPKILRGWGRRIMVKFSVPICMIFSVIFRGNLCRSGQEDGHLLKWTLCLAVLKNLHCTRIQKKLFLRGQLESVKTVKAYHGNHNPLR